MTDRYTDPDGNTTEQTVTWEIWQGYQDRWSRSKAFDDENEARTWLTRRHASCPNENLRLISAETTITRTIAEEITGDRQVSGSREEPRSQKISVLELNTRPKPDDDAFARGFAAGRRAR